MTTMNPTGKHRRKRRHHGEGTVIERRDRWRAKPWTAVVPYLDASGRRREKWLSASSRDEADDLRKAWLRKYAIAPAESFETTVGDYLHAWLSSVERPATHDPVGQGDGRMTPYYSDDLVTIYHGDCREWMPEADVLITDPPYGVGLTAKTTEQRHGLPAKRVSRLYSDEAEDIRALLNEVIPLALAKVQRALIFPGVRMLWAYPEPAAMGAAFETAGTGMSSWGFQTVHPILYYGKDPFLADGKGSRPNGFRDERGLSGPPVNHPCPKPLAWMRWAVARASREGETVLDPFAGSGTTLMAAKALGRKSIGIEIEERYCEIAAQRCSQEVLGLTVA